MHDDLRDELELLRDLGFTHLDLEVAGSEVRVAEAPRRESVQTRETPPATNDQRPATPPERASATRNPQPATGPEGAPSTNAILSTPSLSELAVLAAPCTRCRLARTRTQVVFGTGNPNADLMFVGEAPGHDEDVKGEPFVGRAGQLLTDIIKAMKLTRDDVYIANVIKCRPPENRNPEAEELEACKPYIRKQLEFIKPRVIVTLGRFALQSLTGKGYAISAVRGQWLESDGIKVMPTYHPAYLLRTPSAKKEVWADMKKVMAELGITF
ncbi:MAG TPA: uracil-DNA glycosylase family protein [Thermoanaerobaculia bacterium]|nr:uracil-DNA glycosylase family protein [Thermoanaerobaculia bacterium]